MGVRTVGRGRRDRADIADRLSCACEQSAVDDTVWQFITIIFIWWEMFGEEVAGAADGVDDGGGECSGLEMRGHF